jgi:hypothetical protein
VLWSHGVAAVRLPQDVRLTLARLLGLDASSAISLALECDDVQVLKATALTCNLVLASPHRAVEAEVSAKALRALAVADLPPLFSLPGIVTLRGRTPSPMAEHIISMLPSAPGAAKRTRARASLARGSRERR